MMRRFFTFCLLLTFSGLAPAAYAADAEVQLIRAGRIDDAITQLQQKVKANPSDAEALNLLARAYYAIEDWDDAIAANQKALKLQPNSSEFHGWMGRAYGEKADTVGMIGAATLARKTKNEFERAVQLNPVASQARLDLSEYYIQAPGFMGGGMDKAEQQADATARFDEAASHLIRARMAQQKKDLDVAEQEFRAAIAHAKNPAPYYLNLASFYQTQKRYPEMEQAIVTAVSGADRPSAVLYDAASILNRSGRNLPGAVQYLKQYLAEGRFDEDAPPFRAHYLMGQVLEKMKKSSEAVAEYRSALSMASEFKKAQAALDKLQG
ncbi:TPR repeat protein [Candidatus Koribacter versatilis Ellin345]|uniref:TPR repeat protein n=1 Tax=Koribacter versatilis (strain Ellin345) TaxID=204669 RepID=Q1IQM0_KORVE|nr:tetratricopeptide repeat protein [Candidatus Koribacter versatilis]ABF40830.1 TPR repeat protein [Candidatus Koribacter versatilis Ellin345]